MIITKLQGGLGNQMFQYAIGRSLSIKSNAQLKLDISHFTNDNLRKYRLNYLNIIENIASKKEIKKIYNNFNKLFDNLKPFKKKIIVEKNINFNKNILELKDNFYLYGHWACEKYILDIKPILSKEFTPKNILNENLQKNLKSIEQTNSVSLHIRRGDYLTEKISKIFKITTLEYYKKAIDKILEKEKNPYFYIFSDDIEWTNANLKISCPFHFVSQDNLEDYEELYLMSKCKHNIIANSSFSWWGAWLNNNPDKIVIAPQEWFNDNSKNVSDLLPSDWIKI